jgi:hypothetical protein
MSSNNVDNVDGRVCVWANAGVEANREAHSTNAHDLIQVS